MKLTPVDNVIKEDQLERFLENRMKFFILTSSIITEKYGEEDANFYDLYSNRARRRA
jgi:hypothetical protein